MLHCINASKRCWWNGKQRRPWSDCFFRSSLILVCTVWWDLSVPIHRIYKQRRPSSDATKRGVWSGSTLSAYKNFLKWKYPLETPKIISGPVEMTRSMKHNRYCIVEKEIKILVSGFSAANGSCFVNEHEVILKFISFSLSIWAQLFKTNDVVS